MDVDQTMIVAGVGCRKGVRAAEIEAAILAAFARANVAASKLRLIATSSAKGEEPGIAAAASAIGVPLILISPPDLAAAGLRATTRSERVMAVAGVPSVAEAAALAAGGPTARLIAARIAVGPATCALAETEEVITYGTASSPSPLVGLVGEGRGGGSGGLDAAVPHTPTPTSDPSPQGGGEKQEAAP